MDHADPLQLAHNTAWHARESEGVLSRLRYPVRVLSKLQLNMHAFLPAIPTCARGMRAAIACCEPAGARCALLPL